MVLIKKKSKKSPEEFVLKEQKNKPKIGIYDEFQVKGIKIITYIRLKFKLVIFFLSLVILLGIAWFGYFYWNKRIHRQASSLYNINSGLSNWTNIKKEKNKSIKDTSIITAMKKIENNFSGLKIAGLAQLRAGFLLIKNNKFEEAIKSYHSFILSCDKKSKLRPLGLIGLAYAYNVNQNQKQALAIFENILESRFKITHDIVLWEAARLAFALKDLTIAQKRANQFKKEYPISNLISNIEKILLSVNSKD